MPLPISISSLLHGKSVEWERLEFKEGWNPLEVIQTSSAFANDFHNLGGGYIIIGIEEKDGRPVLPPKGVSPDQIDAIQKEILNLGHSSIQPAYHPIVSPELIDGKHVLVIWAPGGESRPYKAKTGLGKECREFQWFIRKGSSTVRAKGDDERELLSLAATVPFDDRYRQQASLDDLSLKLIEEFLEEVGSELAEETDLISFEDLCRQLNIVGGPSERPFPKNVGLMFFNEHPEKFFPDTQIDIVWFPDGPGGDQFEEKIFKGPIQRMLREALDFIRRNYLHEIVTKHPDRAEATRVKNFPFAAIEEALANAVYHRSYEVREPVEVRITREELSIISYPGPDRSVRLEALSQGRALSRRYRNRRIGDFLKELDITEGRGTGIPKMRRAMRENGSPDPVFEFDEDHSYFLIRLPTHPEADEAATPQVTPQVAPQDISLDSSVLRDLGEALGIPTPQVTTQVTTQVAKLLSAAKTEPQNRAKLQAAGGLKDRKHFRETYADPLITAGWLELTIPDKPTSRLQKYRLTEKGRAWLASLPPSVP